MAGSITVMVNTVAAHNGPPLHVHPFAESFYILEGSFIFEIGGLGHNAAPGDVPHVFQSSSDRDGRYLIVIRQGGIEKFFAECAAHAVNSPNDIATMTALGENYGVQILGPSIAARKTSSASSRSHEIT